MTPVQIARLAALGESETLEFKRTTGTRREAAATVCALLNQQGGQVLFGVTSEGRVVGQDVSDHTIEQVSAELQRIEPQASLSVERVRVRDGREVIAVQVPPGPMRPYVYRRTAYRRIGSSTSEMSSAEYNRILFERMHADQRWENQPAHDWTVEDLDAAEIRRTVRAAVSRGRLEEPASFEPRDLLRGLGLLRGDTLWRAAPVLFGQRERLEFEMPQCLLRVARFRGTDRSEFLDNRQFRGNAFMLLASGERFLRETLPIAGRIVPDRIERLDEPLYPPEATREALANALCHRDYSIGGGSIGLAVYDDRLEVTSAGPLPFGFSPADLFAPHESRPWNPLIARTFYCRGVIEEWGRGTLKMAELTASAGLPLPEIEDSGLTVTVRFRNGQFSARQPPHTDLEEWRRPVLKELRQVPDGLAFRNLRGRFPGLSARQLRGVLEALRRGGRVESRGRGVTARWRYVLESKKGD